MVTWPEYWPLIGQYSKYSPLIGHWQAVTSELVQLARQMMENAYDLVVLDDHEDFSKKVSEPLLDGILGILDGFVVFQEGQVNTRLSLVNTDHVT